jgi:hypothetical protein
MGYSLIKYIKKIGIYEIRIQNLFNLFPIFNHMFLRLYIITYFDNFSKIIGISIYSKILYISKLIRRVIKSINISYAIRKISFFREFLRILIYIIIKVLMLLNLKYTFVR